MDSLLYGQDDEAKIVSVQQVGDNLICVYVRSDEGITARNVEFYPFFFLSDVSHLKGFSAKHWIKELSGQNYFRFLCAFTRWTDMWDGIRHIIDNYNKSRSTKIESYADLDILHVRTDAISQYLLQSGKTLFKEMKFDDVHRMQIDIETYSTKGFKYSNPSRIDDRIILIALSDNRGWEYVINGKKTSEPEMLKELIELINTRDPDAIEGHNIYNFDLPYIIKRCEMHQIEFKIGRDGSMPRSFESRSAFGERTFDYVAFEIAGRHIIDTLQLVQSYDSSKRTLESYGLKYVAKHFGFASPERVYIPGDKISWYWDNEPDNLIRYATDDVRETRLLSEYLSPSYFYLTQMLPFNYGAVARMGSAAKIESLLLREYVHQKYSVPRQQVGAQTTGGYTDIFQTGVLGPVLHVDVESLYPSIMITEHIKPNSDDLDVFHHILSQLTQLRLDTKKKMKTTSEPHEKAKLDAMQSSYKILINSFYGYLGYSRGLFNDYFSADRVTQTGQNILQHLITSIKSHSGTVVEVDTDGILFVPPTSVKTEHEEQKFVKTISENLPKGIILAIDGRYQRIMSYKKKNYALTGYDGKLIIKGSSLVSRSIEKFGRLFINQCIEALLNNNVDALHDTYIKLYKDISEHKMTAADFARTETLKDNLDQYSKEVEEGKRNRTASYEVAISSNTRWRAGDKISYYITGNDANVKGFQNGKLTEEWDSNFPDENVPFYLKRLDEFAEKFEIFFEPKDFRAIFSVDDLFGFSSKGMTILTLPVEGRLLQQGEDESESLRVDPKIWLDEE